MVQGTRQVAPYTDKEGFTVRTYGIADNSLVCPAVFYIVEQLRAREWKTDADNARKHRPQHGHTRDHAHAEEDTYAQLAEVKYTARQQIGFAVGASAKPTERIWRIAVCAFGRTPRRIRTHATRFASVPHRGQLADCRFLHQA